MSTPAHYALRRQTLFTPLYAAVALLTVVVLVMGWTARELWHAPGTVVVIRHMEKATGMGDDPPLSAEGNARAERIAEIVAAMGVDAVYATQYVRTVESAAPLASRLSLQVHVYDARDTTALVKDIDERHRDGTVVVYGHSNTVPEIVQALSGQDIGEIAEDRFGDVYIVVRPHLGRAKVTRLYVR